MKLCDCLPDDLARSIANTSGIRELRIRNGRAVKVNVGGKWYFIGRNSLNTTEMGSITVGEVCDEIVKKSCNNSIYAYEKSLSAGFFTLEDGVRVGVCGEVFGKDGNIFQKYTSLCFRIPHNVNCVSNSVLQSVKLHNAIVIGAPGSGKTTFLRDLSYKLSFSSNVLVVDERGELFYDDKLLNSCNCDVLKRTSKQYAFEVGVRSMSPDYIVCDELSKTDADFVKSCSASGVNVICSAHGDSIADFKKRFGLEDCFDVAILLAKDFSPKIVQLNDIDKLTATDYDK